MRFLENYEAYNEARQNPEEIIKKYYSDIDRNILNKLIKADPTSVIKEGNIVKIGAYVKFIAKIYRNGLLLEDLPRVTEYLNILIKNKSKLKDVDVLKFDNLSELGEVIKPFLNLDSKKITPLVNHYLDKNSYKLLYQDKYWKVYQPLTEKAACVIGYGTSWCTTWGKYSLNKDYRGRTNHFNSYRKNLMIFVNREDKPVWQLHFATKQFNDKLDTNRFNTEFVQLLEDYEELIPIVFPSLKDLNNKSNLTDSVNIIDYLPEDYRNDITEKIKKIIPIDKWELINIIREGYDSDGEKQRIKVKALSELLNFDYEKYKDSIECSRYKFEFPKEFLDKLHWETKQLIDTASKYNSNWEYNSYGDIINIREYEDEIFDDEFNKKLKEYSVSFYNIETSIGGEEYAKFVDKFCEKYSEEYSQQLSNMKKELAKEITDIFTIDINDDIEIDREYFINSLIMYYMNYDDDLKLYEFIEYTLRQNDLPEGISEFEENILNDFNFNPSEAISDFQERILDFLKEKEEEEEVEKERQKEEREKSERIIEENKKKLLKKIDDILVKFNSVNYKIDNEYIIFTLNPELINTEEETVYITYFNKNTKKKHEGYIKIDNLAKYVSNLELSLERKYIKKLR